MHKHSVSVWQKRFRKICLLQISACSTGSARGCCFVYRWAGVSHLGVALISPGRRTRSSITKPLSKIEEGRGGETRSPVIAEIHVPQDMEEAVHLIRCVKNIPGIDVVFTHHSKNGSNWLGIFKVTATDEHLGEFIASSVLAAIMTYANLRLSAEMSLFIREKKWEACTTKIESVKTEDCNLATSFYLCGVCSADVTMEPDGHSIPAWRSYLRIKEVLHTSCLS